MVDVLLNPILKGFNPDPSLLRVGDDFFIANSTFEWFPGVRIHQSRDLVHWHQLPSPLSRLSLLDMKGDPDSCGVWAPHLSYHDGIFYLVYSDVKRFDGRWKDLTNYLTCAESIEGPWSDPVILNHSGFDASLFFDDDGKSYILNLLVDHRKGKFFGGIIIQEYSFEEKRLVGPVHNIFRGSSLGVTEGPVMMKKDGWYYLIVAEGGTEYNHAVSMARSRHITGPYEIHPENPILTSSDDPDNPLQKAGHGSIIQTPDGEWYLSHLTGRPLTRRGRCVLGRETALQRLVWPEGGWPVLAEGGHNPFLTVKVPALPQVEYSSLPSLDDFDDESLRLEYQSLRIPMTEDWVSLKKRPGFLAIKGQESLCSTHRQSMIARRQEDFCFKATAVLEFSPDHFQQSAGIVYYYNTRHFIYLYVSKEDDVHNTLSILVSDDNNFSEPLVSPIILNNERVSLRLQVNREKVSFGYKEEGSDWRELGISVDGSIISDDYVQQKVEYKAAFTGAFIGLCCQDYSSREKWAYFDSFEYISG